jgi:hypothetical protein
MSFHFLCPLQFLSKMFYNFHYKDTLLLFKIVPRNFLVIIINEIAFYISTSENLPLVFSSDTDFCMLILYLQLFWYHLFVLIIFLVDFQYIRSCHLPTVTIWLLFLFGCYLFFLANFSD